MTPQELKNSILQRAIEGKLVEQRPEEGTVHNLLLNTSVKKGGNPESLFDIPQSWEWINLADICNLIGGYAFKSSKYLENGVRVIRISDFNERGLLNSNKKFYKEEKFLSKYLIEPYDILMCMTGGTVGKTVFLGEINEKLYLNQRVAAIRVKNKFIIDNNYLYYVISSKYLKDIINRQKNSTNDNISMKLIQRFPIPLPPLQEQKRIVEKIEELMPLVESYEKNWQSLEDLNKKFPETMKKSLLQEAIKGKLVEQRKEEGTGEELYKLIQDKKKELIKKGKIKKQKSLPEITEDEIPFDIPDSWKWVRLGEVFQFINGDRGKNYPAKSKLKEQGEIPFISAVNLKDGTVDEKDLLYLDIEQYERLGSGKLLKNDIVLCIRGSLGKNCIYPFEKGAIASSLVILRNYKKINLKFVRHYLNSYLFYSETMKYDNGTAQPNLSAKNLKKIIFPLPPLQEQKRIVEKLEKFLPLCDQLITGQQ